MLCKTLINGTGAFTTDRVFFVKKISLWKKNVSVFNLIKNLNKV